MGKLIIYRLLDKSGQCLYIGKTKNLDQDIEAIAKSRSHAKRQLTMLTKEISYIHIDETTEAEFIRRHLIHNLQPLYNETEDIVGLNQPYMVTISDIDWITYGNLRNPSISLFNKIGYTYAQPSTKAKLDKTTPEGLPLLKTKEIQGYELDIDRTEKGNLSSETNRKYCRFIVLDKKRYFYISDILTLLDGSTGKKHQVALLDSGLLDNKDIIIMEETGVNNVKPRKAKRTVLGSEHWLEMKVLQSVSLKEYRGLIGWTSQCRYLYEGVLGLDVNEAPEYMDLLINLAEVEDLIWIESRMKEEKKRVESANQKRDFLIDIKEMLLAIDKNLRAEALHRITKGMPSIALSNPEEILNISINTQGYKSAKDSDLLELLHLRKIENRQQYGLLYATRPGKIPKITYHIQAGFFHGNNFSELLADNNDQLLQCVWVAKKANAKLKKLNARYKAIKLAECGPALPLINCRRYPQGKPRYKDIKNVECGVDTSSN